MNKHFQDTRYYLTRAFEHARLGVRESIHHGRGRVRTLIGREAEPESRIDRLRGAVAMQRARVDGQARTAIAGARSAVGERRERSEPVAGSDRR